MKNLHEWNEDQDEKQTYYGYKRVLITCPVCEHCLYVSSLGTGTPFGPSKFNAQCLNCGYSDTIKLADGEKFPYVNP